MLPSQSKELRGEHSTATNHATPPRTLHHGPSHHRHPLSTALAAGRRNRHSAVALHAYPHRLARSKAPPVRSDSTRRLSRAGYDARYAHGLLRAHHCARERVRQPDPAVADWRTAHGTAAVKCCFFLAYFPLADRVTR